MRQTDEARFEALWHAHHRRVLAYALRRIDEGAVARFTCRLVQSPWGLAGMLGGECSPGRIGWTFVLP